MIRKYIIFWFDDNLTARFLFGRRDKGVCKKVHWEKSVSHNYVCKCHCILIKLWFLIGFENCITLHKHSQLLQLGVSRWGNFQKTMSRTRTMFLKKVSSMSRNFEARVSHRNSSKFTYIEGYQRCSNDVQNDVQNDV